MCINLYKIACVDNTLQCKNRIFCTQQHFLKQDQGVKFRHTSTPTNTHILNRRKVGFETLDFGFGILSFLFCQAFHRYHTGWYSFLIFFNYLTHSCLYLLLLFSCFFAFNLVIFFMPECLFVKLWVVLFMKAL